MKTRKSIQAKLDKLNDTKRKDTVIDFEELGVDRLFIDESHFYKNLYLYTKMRNVGGIAQTEAQKSSDLFMKCRYLDEITGDRGTVFATGTPVSNSMVELYSVQRYLQYDTLMQNGLQHFDSWASTFGETVTALELAPEGTNYRAKTRFAKFYNLPELMQMFREVADIQTADMLKLPVPKVNYHNIKTKPSEIQTEMVANLAKRAEKVRARAVEPNIDNMLKITNDGRKLALDQRMIDPMLPDDPDSKVNACVDNVYRIWEEHADTKATRLCSATSPLRKMTAALIFMMIFGEAHRAWYPCRTGTVYPRSHHRCTEKGTVCKGTKRRSPCVTRLYPENGSRHKCPRPPYRYSQFGLSVATL